MPEGQEIRASREEVEGTGFVGQGRWNRLMRAAVSSSLAALLLVAGPGGAFAQTATQEQYAAQDQYSDGGVQQAPVGPGDPAYPGLAAQPQQTFGQTLAGVSAELGGISQGLAALGQGSAPAAAQTPAASDPSAAVPAFSAPSTAVVGGTSPEQAPVAVVDPYSAAVNAVSAVGAGAPGYTTTASSQAPQGVAVLGGFPQDQQAPVAVVDPYSAAVGAVSPSVPGETAQVAQVLQQLLTQRDVMLAAQQAQQGDAFWDGVVATDAAFVDQRFAGMYANLFSSMLAQGSAGASGPAPGPDSFAMTGEYLCRSVTTMGFAPDTPTTIFDSPLVTTTPGVAHDPVMATIDRGDVNRSCRPTFGGSTFGP